MNVVFSEVVTGLTTNGFSVSNATITSLTGSGTSYVAIVTPSTNGSFSFSVAAEAARNSQSKFNTASNVLTYVFDTQAPVISFGTASAFTMMRVISISGSTGELLSNFTLSNIVTSNATVSDFLLTGTTFTATVTANVAGHLQVSVPAGTVTDLAGNSNTSGNVLEWTYDATSPTAGSWSTFSSTATAITVNWTIASDTVTQDPLIKYRLFRSSSNNMTSLSSAIANGTEIGSGLTGNPVSYTFSGLVQYTQYFFALFAIDEAGNAVPYGTVPFMTKDGLAPIPGASGLVTVTNPSSGIFHIAWSEAMDLVTPAGSFTYNVTIRLQP